MGPDLPNPGTTTFNKHHELVESNGKTKKTRRYKEMCGKMDYINQIMWLEAKVTPALRSEK